ncbi:hypothetical protein U9M48_026254 [Paspalum notatum var. saurae]|uniref:Bifunctional inhibitor/plant lipid transfer protein/seed storage helical domain-containing protein n=1 Tax=Paspalum notatum var. saurae TaxID=547442 RepID=A0AAQ3TUX1_PASNO
MRRILAAALAAVVACVAAAQGTGYSGAVPSCAAKLVPCAGYLNSTASSAPPAEACCRPLRDAAANETACMCAMLLNKAALRAFGVAPEQGLRLAKRCNVTADESTCATTSAAASAGNNGPSTAASSASTGGASASSVAKPTANGSSVARRLSFTGASFLVGFSFVWWSIMA